MSIHVYNCGTIAIASGQQNSTAVAADPHYQNAEGLIIYAPSAVTGTITVQVSADGGSTYQNLQSSGADVTVGAGDAVSITFQGWTHLRVSSGSAEGATRTFTIRAVERVRSCI